ncbi:MAG: ribonuclease D [Nitrospiraceae bacterium]
MTHGRPSHYITEPGALEALCRRLRQTTRIALDTEFVGEETFIPRLELIQIASHDEAAAVDFPALSGHASLDALWAVICDPAIEKIVHAGRQDLELTAMHAGRIPTPFFDTQIAAAMVGYGAQIAYAGLVQRVTGKRLAKSHTFTNWSQRPLTKEQITYALEDVQFLLPIHDRLRARLKTLGREEWLREEFTRLQGSLGERSREPQDRYQRIRGWDNLQPRAAAVLRELASWREGEAKRRNVPRGRVLRDEVLLQVARQAPTKPDELRAIRGVHPSEVDRSGDALLRIIQHALALPASEWPEIPRERKPEPEATGKMELLQAVLKARALDKDISPTLLATAADLQALVDAKEDPERLNLPILQGWRRTLAGDMLLQLLSGKVAVAVDPQSGKVRLSQVS